jgi:Semialdehyde dehydrogenase, NAD binding domain
MMAAFLLLFLVLTCYNGGIMGFSLRANGRLLAQPATSKYSSMQVRTQTTMMAGKQYSVGIVGATGAVGEEILGVLETRKFPCSAIKLFASDKSAGKTVNSDFYGALQLEAFTFEVASKLDVVLLAVGGDFSLEWAEKLAAAGVLVIDNSSAFRQKYASFEMK